MDPKPTVENEETQVGARRVGTQTTTLERILIPSERRNTTHNSEQSIMFRCTFIPTLDRLLFSLKTCKIGVPLGKNA